MHDDGGEITHPDARWINNIEKDIKDIKATIHWVSLRMYVHSRREYEVVILLSKYIYYIHSMSP